MDNTINGRMPEEIKKGLLHCSEDGCKGCNYEDDCNMADGFSVLAFDALAYIQQLECERDAAVEELRGICSLCAHYSGKSYINCDKTGTCIHVNYGIEDAVDEWQWRGV